MRRTVISALVTCLAASLAVATNNSFLPGDAFFSVALSQSVIERWTASSEATFEFSYARFDGEFFACGNTGYSTLAVEGISPELRLALAEAYWRYVSSNRPLYREEGNDGKSVLEQTNSVVALIYNKSFDLEFPLGLKFNEDWVSQGSGQYSGYFETAKPVTFDWKNAASIAPLSIREKLDPLAHLAASYDVARTIDEPLHIGSEDIQIVLVGFVEQDGYAVIQRCPDLQLIFDYADGARFMVVTKGVIREFDCDEKGLRTESTIKLPLTGSNSWIPKIPLKPNNPQN